MTVPRFSSIVLTLAFTCAGAWPQASESAVAELLDDYFYGTESAASKSANKLVALGFDAIHPHLSLVLDTESQEHLDAIHLYTWLDDERTVPVLVRFLQEYADSGWMRRSPNHTRTQTLKPQVEQAVASFGYDVVASALGSVTTDHEYYWTSVARIYHFMGDTRAIPALLDMLLTDDRHEVLMPTVTALHRLEARSIVPELEYQFKHHPSGTIRTSIMDLLRRLWGEEEADALQLELALADPIGNWGYVRVAGWKPALMERLTEFRRMYLEDIALLPEQYAGGSYQCGELTVSTEGVVRRGRPGEEQRPVWNAETKAWVDENRKAIIAELIRPYEMWGNTSYGEMFASPTDALVLAYLGATDALPWLRESFVKSWGVEWTGEGTHPHSYFTGGVYPYHLVLKDAIEYLTGKPVSAAIELEKDEIDELRGVHRDDYSRGVISGRSIYRLHCLKPEIASAEIFRSFRIGGAPHSANLVLSINEILANETVSKETLLGRMGAPDSYDGADWVYEIERGRPGQFDHGGRYVLRFDGDILLETTIYSRIKPDQLTPWE